VNSECRPLLLSYGGGHAKIMIALAKSLAERGVDYTLIGLTTAYAEFRRAGLQVSDVTELVNEDEDEEFIRAVRPFVAGIIHPDVEERQTVAYFALGYRALFEQFGEDEALARLRTCGRKSFEPVSVMLRYLRNRLPSVVVTTTSPRFELAMVKAARELGIPTVAIGDHFLVGEMRYIAKKNYAEHLVVLSEEIADTVRRANRGISVHAFGNPAFDELAPKSGDADRRADLRKCLGGEGRKILLWPLGGAAASGSGKKLLTAEEIIPLLEEICARSGEWRYVLRPHPNWPIEPIKLPELINGIVCPSHFTPEDSILASDLVCAESSTMGLQALLKGVPVINYGHAEFTTYPKFGWASVANNPAELLSLVIEGNYLTPPSDLIGLVGGASTRVARLVEGLHYCELTACERRST